ncbi:MAG: hypothetical protein C4K49_09265 [Candidatus Thorarchaeota archaeon]|nr:MAG: hypothetical protein C4K49_09265 [Candidatus Thorarchaeota archaeon]
MMMTTFVVDTMLGKICRWLRLLGYDTAYSTKNDDNLLLQIAETEGRVLLTSDAELHRRAEGKGIPSVLLRGEVDEEIAALFNRFSIDPRIDPARSRCSKCNGHLTEISEAEKEQIRGRVFEQTYNHYDRFWLCTDCSSVFFQGGHWKNINRYMEHIRSLMEPTQTPVGPTHDHRETRPRSP